MTLAGTLAAPSGKVKLVLAYGKTKTTLNATVKNGRFNAKVKLTRSAAKTKKLSVTLTYAGNANYAPATAKASVKIKR